MIGDFAVEIKDLTISYHGIKALEDISFQIPYSQLVGIIGPNGAGKSTLIKGIMGLLHIESGNIRIFNETVQKVYKKIAYVPQHSDIDLAFPILVEEAVMMGRYPHLSWWQRITQKDKEIVASALQKLGICQLKKRQIGELSGGQRQRVFLARALAQQADLFFLDEPFAGTDVMSEEIIINQLKELRNEGKTIFVVHHDLSKVQDYFDEVILLNKKLVKHGSSQDVFCVEDLCEAYNGSIKIAEKNNRLLVVGQ